MVGAIDCLQLFLPSTTSYHHVCSLAVYIIGSALCSFPNSKFVCFFLPWLCLCLSSTALRQVGIRGDDSARPSRCKPHGFLLVVVCVQLHAHHPLGSSSAPVLFYFPCNYRLEVWTVFECHMRSGLFLSHSFQSNLLSPEVPSIAGCRVRSCFVSCTLERSASCFLSWKLTVYSQGSLDSFFFFFLFLSAVLGMQHAEQKRGTGC